jgi:hypothetical protein
MGEKVVMKKILVPAIIILFTASVKAQTAAPNELNCTERAFNFSFSLGSKWKLSAPKMGPSEVTREELDYFPAWALKHNDATPEPQMPFNVRPLGYTINQQNYAALFYHNSFSVKDKPAYLLPGLSFSPPINYTILKPDFLVSPIGHKP